MDLNRAREIELQAKARCCEVKFAGKERELDLMEKHNKEMMACKIQAIRNSLCCCKGASNEPF